MSADGTFVPHPSWPTIVELAIELWGQPNKALSSHDDVRFGANGSKSVKPSAFIWKDHESGDGGGYVEMWRLARRGAPLPKRPKPTPGTKVPPWENIGTVYHYHDANGDLVLDVVRTRTGQPRFLQRAPDPGSRSGWKWSVKHIAGHDCLLYRLPGLRASGDAMVWITEGEKDADRLHDEGLIATCSIGGAGKWRDEYAEEFRGKHCIALQDNDQAGRDHAAAVARSLSGIAASVKVLLLPGLPDKGDVSDWLDDSGTVEELERLAGEAEVFTTVNAEEPPHGDTQLVWPTITEISEIAPRQWAYGKFLLFGSASCLGAMDGSGKGMTAVVIVLAMITGYPLLREKVWRTGKVAIISYEDDIDEWKRRIAAACLYYSAHGFSIVFITKPGGRVTLAERNQDRVLVFPDTPRIVFFLKQIEAVGLIIDPFNNAHAMEDGNNNVAIAAVAQEISSIARDANVAALLLHHLRKSSTGSIDDLMGATSLRANFRNVRIHAGMSTEEALQFGIPSAEAWRFFYVSGSKENYAPPFMDRVWFEKVSVKLDNPAGIYTEGDEVGAVVRWTPPALFKDLDNDKLRPVFDTIAAKPHSPVKQATEIDWVGKPLMDLAGRTPAQAGAIVAQWLQSKTLIPGEPFKTGGRNKIKTVTVDPAKVAAILAGRMPPSEAREQADG
jgi:hypothetical protein